MSPQWRVLGKCWYFRARGGKRISLAPAAQPRHLLVSSLKWNISSRKARRTEYGSAGEVGKHFCSWCIRPVQGHPLPCHPTKSTLAWGSPSHFCVVVAVVKTVTFLGNIQFNQLLFLDGKKLSSKMFPPAVQNTYSLLCAQRSRFGRASIGSLILVRFLPWPGTLLF